jgi:ABC-type antimicrobial peptide transport system permease subunit
MSDLASGVVRVLAFIFAGIGLGATAGILRDARAVGMSVRQVARFVSFGGFLLTIVITEVVLIGRPANWHTWLDLTFAMIGWFGVSPFIEARLKRRASAHGSSRPGPDSP